MWILPKQISSTISPSVRGTKGLETGSDVFCQMCEKSLMWRSKPSLSRTWLTRLKRGGFIKHLFTRTLNPSLIESFEGWWTSSVEVFPASRFLKLELEKLRKTQDTCSLLSPKESESANLEFAFLKTSREFLAAKPQMENQFSNMSSEHWKKWVTEQRQEYLARAKLGRLIKEKESLSWATPRAGATDNTRPNNKGGIPFGDQVKRNWPTASVAGCVEGGVAKNVQMDEKGFSATRENGTKYGAKLRDAVIHHEKNWMSPTVMDSADIKGERKKSSGGQHPPLSQQVQGYTRPKKKEENFPTPTARDWKDTAGSKKGRDLSLPKMLFGCTNDGPQDQTKNNTNGKNQELLQQRQKQILKRNSWNTPTNGRADQGVTESQLSRVTLKLNQQIDVLEENIPQVKRLNPNWVEQLMGLPVGWTQIDTE